MNDKEINEAVARKLGITLKSCIKGGSCLHPSYSTDIKAAWELMERYPMHHVKKEDAGYECFLANDEDDIWLTAPTAPMAICKAFLKLHSDVDK